MYVKRGQTYSAKTPVSSQDAPVLQRRTSLLPPFKDRLVSDGLNEHPLATPRFEADNGSVSLEASFETLALEHIQVIYRLSVLFIKCHGCLSNLTLLFAIAIGLLS